MNNQEPKDVLRDESSALEAIIARANDYREYAREYRIADNWYAAGSCDGKASGLFAAARIIREASKLSPVPPSKGIDEGVCEGGFCTYDADMDNGTYCKKHSSEGLIQEAEETMKVGIRWDRLEILAQEELCESEDTPCCNICMAILASREMLKLKSLAPVEATGEAEEIK